MDWKKHFYRVGSHEFAFDDLPEDVDAFASTARRHIEPWLSAVFQAEHLNLLVGSGLTAAVSKLAGSQATSMSTVAFGTKYDERINEHANRTSHAMNRGDANIEDQFRSAVALLEGLEVAGQAYAVFMKERLDATLLEFLRSLLATERGIAGVVGGDAEADSEAVPENVEAQAQAAAEMTEEAQEAEADQSAEAEFEGDANLESASLEDQAANAPEQGDVEEPDDPRLEHATNILQSFLLSFASRAASRERLHIFTTNYDRLIEHGCDLAGLRLIDRFVGLLNPVFRSSRVEVDVHYNPPGIRGEPRFMEGVIRFTKLHGSLDWFFSPKDKRIRRHGIPFGAPDSHSDVATSPIDTAMIYPNPAKDVETTEYPYAELFRDFAASICRPNAVVVTYGYGFGDDHVNRVLLDMLAIPSTHLVIISHGIDGRLKHFCSRTRDAQVSLLLGEHFGNLSTLVENYLPKPALDYITSRMTNLLKDRPQEGGAFFGVGLGGQPPTLTQAGGEA